MAKCKGKTKTGRACRAPAGASGLCYLHANPEKVRALGQIGGRKNRRTPMRIDVPSDISSANLRSFLVEVLRALGSRELRAREASAMVQVCNVLSRIIPVADVERRLEKLERQIEVQSLGRSMQSQTAEGNDPSDVQLSPDTQDADGHPETREGHDSTDTSATTGATKKAEN